MRRDLFNSMRLLKASTWSHPTHPDQPWMFSGWKHSHLLVNQLQTDFSLTIQILPAKAPPSWSGDGCIHKTKFQMKKQSQKSFTVSQTHTFQAEISSRSEKIKLTAREVIDTFSWYCLNIIRSEYQAWSCCDIWEVPRDKSSGKLSEPGTPSVPAETPLAPVHTIAELAYISALKGLCDFFSSFHRNLFAGSIVYIKKINA